MLHTADTASVGTASPCPLDIAALYEHYYPVIFAYAYRRAGQRMEAEDIAAQTFLQALRALDRYESRDAPIVAWLLRIASGVVIDRARRRGREALWAVDGGVTPEERASDVAPDDWAERCDRASRVWSHLAGLSPEQRRAMWLRYGEDQSLNSVAAGLGRTPGATKQLLHRAIKTLRERMRVDGETWR